MKKDTINSYNAQEQEKIEDRRLIKDTTVNHNPTKNDFDGEVIAFGLNCRSKASYDSEVLKVLPYGAHVTITEQSIDNNGQTWGKTSNGWVSMEYVKKI